jgi:hypothetical protein
VQRHYTLRPSRRLALLLILLCALTITLLWLLPMRTMDASVLTALVLCWGGYCLFLDANLSLQHSCVALRLEEYEEVMLVLRNGKHLPGRLSSDSLVTPYLIVLNIALSEQRGWRSLAILPDTLGKDSFRQLSVALRWGDKADQAPI